MPFLITIQDKTIKDTLKKIENKLKEISKLSHELDNCSDVKITFESEKDDAKTSSK